ncbi:hypothetical protein ACJ8A7_00780, partial [Klebsiella pneumoniae]
MGLKPYPKPIAKSTGKPDQRRRDNKDTPGKHLATKALVNSQGNKKFRVYMSYLYPDYISRLLKMFLNDKFCLVCLCTIPFAR